MAVGHRHLAVHQRVGQLGLEDDRLDGQRRQHPPLGAQQSARLLDGVVEAPERLGQPHQDQVADRMPRELALTEPVLDQGRRSFWSSASSGGAGCRPGGGTPRGSSRRKRPEDPPSSATLTTTVIEPA